MHDIKIPPLESRKNVAFWRLNLFATTWGDTPQNRYCASAWLVAKTRALVESDRLFMPDGPGAIGRIVSDVKRKT